MRPIENTFSIVALGAWNPAIFNGQWLTDNILLDCTKPITFSVPSNFLPHQTQQPLQIEFEGVRVYPTQARLQICASQPTVMGIALAAQVFNKILGLLRHTPVQSVGINFGFEALGNLSQIESWLAHDETMASAPAGFTLNSSQATRQFQFSDDAVLNVTANLADRNASISFNFDLGSHPIDWYLANINEGKISSCHDTAIEFSHEVFDQEEDNG